MKNLGSIRLEERQFEYDHGQTLPAVQMCTRADSSQEEGRYVQRRMLAHTVLLLLRVV